MSLVGSGPMWAECGPRTVVCWTTDTAEKIQNLRDRGACPNSHSTAVIQQASVHGTLDSLYDSFHDVTVLLGFAYLMRRAELRIRLKVNGEEYYKIRPQM